nr:MAG TPA: hypothetical protein [Caudoviricetes sp.]
MTKTSSTTKTKRKKTAVPTYKWDVVQAEHEYVTNSKMTILGIAKKYGISNRTVSIYAAKHEWTEKRKVCMDRALEKTMDEHAKMISERNTAHLGMWRNAQIAAMNSLKRADSQKKTGDVTKSIYALQAAIDGERKTLGLPTVINRNADPSDDQERDTLNLVEAAERAEQLLKEADEKAGES